MNEIEKKIKEDITKLQLINKNIIEESKDYDKRLLKAILEEIMRSVRKTFESFPQTQAPEMAKMVDAPELEKDIERLLSETIEKAIKMLAEKMTKAIKAIIIST